MSRIVPLIMPTMPWHRRPLITNIFSANSRIHRLLTGSGTTAETAMTIKDVEKFMFDRNASLISLSAPSDRYATTATLPNTAAVPIKCIVFMIVDSPLLVILRMQDRVVERALAQHLKLPRSSISLAPAADLVPLTGFPVGHVPPFGHRHPLPTIVDQSIAHDSVLIGFGEDIEFKMTGKELLRLTNGVAAAVSSSSLSSSSETFNDRVQVKSAIEQNTGEVAINYELLSSFLPRTGTDGANAITTTHPFAATNTITDKETSLISLSGIISRKRRIANLLVFLDLVPLPVSQATATPQWEHSETEVICDVQLILGKTLEKKLGRAPAAALFKSLKPGQVISVAGKPQQRQQSAARVGNRINTTTTVALFDVVVHEIQINGTADASQYMDGRTDEAEEESDNEEEEDMPRSKHSKNQQQTPFSALLSSSFPLYELRIPRENIIMVDSIEKIEVMRQVLLQKEPAVDTGDTTSNDNKIIYNKNDEVVEHEAINGEKAGKSGRGGAQTSTWQPRACTAMDCEWEPNRMRNEPSNPVSILQIGSDTHVFLIDMLAICSDSKSTMVLTSTQRALSDFLIDYFGDSSVVKVGFGLRYDLKRLIESYPWLPCFGGIRDERDPPDTIPFRSHVDALLLARAALEGTKNGGHHHTSFKRMGLASLCKIVLGQELDKSEQTSSWKQRPLTENQIRYAAADVVALVDVYHSLINPRPQLHSTYWMTQFSSQLYDILPLRPWTVNGRQATDDSNAIIRSSSGGNHGGGRPGIPGGGARVTDRGFGRTSNIPSNNDVLLSYLGRPIPEGGKLAIIRLAASTAMPNGVLAEPERMPRFPRGSGLLEFSNNTFLLFVNVPSQRYPNEFSIVEGAEEKEKAQGNPTEYYHPKCTMTWWPGNSHTLSHPMMKRLLPEAAELPDQQPPTVLLFVRPRREDYIGCGRLLVDGVDSVDGQLCVTWKLMDYASDLMNNSYFQNILEIQMKKK